MPQMYAPRADHSGSARAPLPIPDTDHGDQAPSAGAVDIASPPACASTAREVEREHREAIAFFRGALVASAVVAPFWAAVAIVVWFVTR